MSAQSDSAIATALQEAASSGNYLRCEEIVRRALAFEAISENLGVCAASLSHLHDHTTDYHDDDPRQLLDLMQAAQKIADEAKNLLSDD